MRVLALGRVTIASAVIISGSACGPVQYIAQVPRGAVLDLEAAKAANADKYAPYEYTSAVEYLHKAREEEGYADHQAAVHFGKIAQEMAQKARQIALAQAASGSPPPAPPPGDSENENPVAPPPAPPRNPR
jgi:Domain of unknown function (DUF4398)